MAFNFFLFFRLFPERNKRCILLVFARGGLTDALVTQIADKLSGKGEFIMFKNLLVFVCCFAVFGIGYAVAQEEEVGPPPDIQGTPSEMVVVPSEGQSVYLVPGQVGLYFYGGLWYRFYGNAWYQSSVYGGPWINLVMPPTFVSAIPPDYVLSLPSNYYRIPYRSFHDHWRGWDREHHWNRQAWYNDHRDHRWGYHGKPGYDRYSHHSGWDRGHGGDHGDKR